ncbi:B-cell receptor-associated protein 31-like-domain-containing protein [Pyronema omphalodes]|nr:B-cell receptor-associated protein 31-like-domain-containing protein [Pyronema omphalodes]
MTLYYSLVFAILMLEMSIFLLLVFPLPFTWRKKTFEFISHNPVIAKLQYGMKITFIFILILFVDSVNRVYRVKRELAEAATSGPYAQPVMGGDRTEIQARKFYSERNLYLCGFTLFLSLILNRTHSFILDILRLEQTVKELRASASNNTKKGIAAEVIAKKDADNEAILSQAKGLQAEYDRLSEEYKTLQDKYMVLSGENLTPKKDL